MPTAPGTMTMSDIAALAAVRRPVVSIWRRRPAAAGESAPFPEPVLVREGVEEFAADDVVAWLELTCRGNNPHVRADVAAYVRPPSVTAGVSVQDAVTALLCLKARSGTLLGGLDPDELLDLADGCDPDDEVLYREVEALGDDLHPLAVYVDALTDAAYDVSGALRRVESRREPASEVARWSLAEAACELVGDVGAALAIDLGADAVDVLDLTGASPELVDAIRRVVDERIEVTASARGDGPHARAARRSHLIRGWATGPARPRPGPRLVVARYPHPGASGMTPVQVLTAVDDLQLELTAGQRAVVLGPASVLCDRPADPRLEQQRDQILRLGRLRAAVRLPKGLVAGRSREALGLWVLTGERVDGRPGDRWVATADLVDQPAGASHWQPLVGDLVAAVAPTARARAHAFRLGRIVQTAQLLARGGDLVTPGARPSALAVPRSSDELLALRDLVAQIERIRVSPRALSTRELRVSDRSDGVHFATLGDLVADRRVRLLAGYRLDDDLVGDASGSVRVIGTSQLASDGPESGAQVDPLLLEERHPRARRTEPKDVVFAVTPRPRAVVDVNGMSVVRYPARVLRVQPGAGVVPEAVAAALNALPETARAWRTWSIPLVDPADAQALGEVLRQIDGERRAAHERMGLLDQLTTRLVGAMASRSVMLAPEEAL